MASEEEIRAYLDKQQDKMRKISETDANAASKIERLIVRLEDRLRNYFNVDESKIPSYINPIKDNFVQTTETQRQYDNIKKGKWQLKINGRKVPKNRIVEKRLAGNKIEITVDEANEAELRRRLQDAYTTVSRRPESDQQKLFTENLALLIEEMSEAAKYSRTYVRPKQVRVDAYLGGLSIKKQSNREAIYDYWENVSKLYEDVENALSNISDMDIGLSKLFDAEEEFKELTKFVGRDLSYVLELEPARVAREDAVLILQKYLVGLAVLYGVGQEFKQLQTGVAIGSSERRFFESMGPQTEFDPSGGRKDLGDKRMGELASLTSENVDDELIQDSKSTDWDTVDPLLAYYASKGNMTTFFQKKYEEVIEALNDYISYSSRSMDGEDIAMLADTVKKDLREASDAFSDTRDVYHLPSSVLDDGKFAALESYRKLIKDNEGAITNFLLAVGKLLWSIEPTFPSRSTKETIRGTFYEVGQKVGRSKGQVDKLRSGLSELIEAIDEYYITPSYSGRLTIGELDFTKRRGAKLIATGMARLGVQNVTGKAYARLLDKTFTVPPRAIKIIYDFLEEVMTGGGNLDRTIIQKGEKAATALAEIFGAKGESSSILEERNNNHFAAIIAYLFEEAGKAQGEEDVLGERKFKGKTLAEREKAYQEEYQKGRAFPLFALPSFLKMYEKDIARSPKTKEGLGKLITLLDEVEDLPVVMKSLLKAHDVLRIMQNEDIVIGYRPRNIYHYDEVIVKMYNEQNIDLSHSEVERIVTEVDSFSNIAKSMGISEEVVYQVKAQFR